MIYFDAAIPYLYNSGIRNYFINFIRLYGIKKFHETITIITPEMFNDLDILNEDSSLNIEFKMLNYVPKIPFFHRILYYEMILRNSLSLNKNDFLFSPYFQLPSCYKGSNIISTIHDTLFFEMKHLYTGKDLLLVNYYNYSAKKSISNGHKIVTVSDFTKNSLVDIFPKIEDRITVVKNTITGDFFKMLTSESPNIIGKFSYEFVLYSGGWEKRKDEKLLIKSILFFIKHFNKKRGLKFVLTGKTESYKKILIKEYGFTAYDLENIILYDRLSKSDLALAYRNCLFVLNTSLFEGFGFPVLEALLANKRILCSKIQPYIEIGGNFCDYIYSREFKDLAFQIAIMYDEIKGKKGSENSILKEHAIGFNNYNTEINFQKINSLFK